jgi:hypothetical protein
MRDLFFDIAFKNNTFLQSLNQEYRDSHFKVNYCHLVIIVIFKPQKHFDEDLWLLNKYMESKGNDRNAGVEASEGRIDNRLAEIDLIEDVMKFCASIPPNSEVTEEHWILFMDMVMVHYEV